MTRRTKQERLTCSSLSTVRNGRAPRVTMLLVALFLPYTVAQTNWDCAAAEGSFTRMIDCTLTKCISSGDLKVTGRNDLTTVTAASGQRHFDLGKQTLVLRLLRLTGGDVSNAARGSATYGGSIYAANGGGALLIYSSLLTDNKAQFGGCIFGGYDVHIRLYYTNITHSTATTAGGGGIYMNGNVDDSVSLLHIYKGVVAHNTASSGGGGVFCVNGADCTFNKTSILENVVTLEGKTTYGGGGLAAVRTGNYQGTKGKLFVYKSIIEGNHIKEKGIHIIPPVDSRKGNGIYCGSGTTCEVNDTSVVAMNYVEFILKLKSFRDGLFCSVTLPGAKCSTDGTSYISPPCLQGTYGTRGIIMTPSNWWEQPHRGTCTPCPPGKFGDIMNGRNELGACKACSKGKFSIINGLFRVEIAQ